jgi:hypothetical protein
MSFIGMLAIFQLFVIAKRVFQRSWLAQRSNLPFTYKINIQTTHSYYCESAHNKKSKKGP